MLMRTCVHEHVGPAMTQEEMPRSTMPFIMYTTRPLR